MSLHSEMPFVSKVSHSVSLKCTTCETAQWQDKIHGTFFFLFALKYRSTLTHTKFAQFNEMGNAFFFLLPLINVMSLCPATCSFMFVMILHWTASIYLFCSGIVLPVIMHMNPGLCLVLLMYDH